MPSLMNLGEHELALPRSQLSLHSKQQLGGPQSSHLYLQEMQAIQEIDANYANVQGSKPTMEARNQYEVQDPGQPSQFRQKLAEIQNNKDKKYFSP